jgi:diguanylate cyclase (GGDEF)-like protein/PAS domain S-box-containing protein
MFNQAVGQPKCRTARRKISDSCVPSSLIAGDGEMAGMVRRFDWGATPLGRIETWSDTLITTVNLLLASRHPMFLWWGPQLIQFYNDSYRPSLGGEKHPAALGQPGIECWPEIWPVIGPQIQAVMACGAATFPVNQLVPINRNSKLEEVFWTYGYSPVRDSGGTVQGTLVVCTETTEQALNERRLRTLLSVGADSQESEQVPESQTLSTYAQAIVTTLGRDPADFPLAALFLFQGTGSPAISAVSQGILAESDRWPLATVLNSQASLVVEDLQRRFGDLICEPWPESVTRACLLPLCISGSSAQAVLVLGISPRLPFDHGYQALFQLVGTRIAGLLQSKILQLERAERTKALEQLGSVLAEKAALLDLAKDAIVVRDMQDKVLFWNRGAEAMYGWPSQEALGRSIFELLNTEFVGTTDAEKAKLLSQDRWEGEVTQQKRDGTPVIVSCRSALQRDLQGDPARVVTMHRDITARKQEESNHRLLSERLSLATAIANIGVWEWDLATNTLVWDATMFAIYGLEPVVPMPYERWVAAVHPEDLPRVEAALHRAVGEKDKSFGEFRIIRPDNSVREVSVVRSAALDEFGGVSRVVGVCIDVTERKQAEESLRKREVEMTHLAEHDFLTSLPNRLLLNDRLNQAILLAARHRKQLAVLFLDLDGFKHINDSLGHSVGDKLLQSVAKRLANRIRGSDTLSRQGGDEFIVLLSEVEDPEDTAIAATRLLKGVAESYSIEGHDLHVTASIGVSVYPSDGLDAETLIKNADTAMYQAKENGRRGFQFFKQEMNVRAVQRQSIEEDLRRALERQEFTVHYQPKVNLTTGDITGAEALVRWTHPERGPISPAEFIPVAEDSGLILPLGKWVLREACRQAHAWMDEGLPVSTIAVNISASEFRNEHFLENVLAILRETALDPRALELEITESVLMKHAESTESILKTLRANGVQLAIDDFGTGYSSLSYLKKFPINALKIDQSFVRQITAASGDTTIVTAIISMGRSLNLRVVAEGVETQEELAFLRAHRCDEGQCYYFGRPTTSREFAHLLKIGMPEAVLR